MTSAVQRGPAPARAVVFAYHNVGARCLEVLLAHRIDVALVVTHDDDPAENIWFDSVAALAHSRGIASIAPDDPNAPAIVERVATLSPDFLFSFYYRRMLGPALLAIPSRGALNMHGSLLPRYRGRSPVNWAVLNGERETGATLHHMVDKPDAGDIVARTSVPILPDDTARDVFDKVTMAAASTLDSALPGLIDGTAPRLRQDLAHGEYCRGRKPADGIIDWTGSATAIHNLVRAVAPPWPGALTTIAGQPARVLRARVIDALTPARATPQLAVDGERILARCGGGGTLDILALEVDGVLIAGSALAQRLGRSPIDLPVPDGAT